MRCSKTCRSKNLPPARASICAGLPPPVPLTTAKPTSGNGSAQAAMRRSATWNATSTSGSTPRVWWREPAAWWSAPSASKTIGVKAIPRAAARAWPPMPVHATTTSPSEGCCTRCSRRCSAKIPDLRAGLSSIRRRCSRNGSPSKRDWGGSDASRCWSRRSSAPMCCWESSC